MSQKKKTTPVVEAAAGVNSEKGSVEESRFLEEKASEAVVETPVVEETIVEETIDTTEEVAEEVSHEAVLIPSGRFVAENGDEYEFAVNAFTFQGKVYTKDEALSNHSDVLERLVALKSFILKKL